MPNPKYPKVYDADDMHFAHVVAHQDLTWVVNSLDDIKDKVEKLKAECAEKGVHSYTFNNLEVFLEMLKYVMTDRRDHYEGAVDLYQKEMDAHNQGASK